MDGDLNEFVPIVFSNVLITHRNTSNSNIMHKNVLDIHNTNTHVFLYF